MTRLGFTLNGTERVREFSKSKVRNPIVSVSVVTFNHELFISKCLDGILNQKTNFVFEIVLGEDDSSDRTREICLEYAKKYDNIRLFLHDRSNVIRIKGTETGRYNMLFTLSKCRGKYVALCDGDDYWTDPNKLQSQVDFLEKNSKFSFTFHDINIINEQGDIIRKKSSAAHLFGSKRSFSPKFLLLGPYIFNTSSIVFRNKLILPKWSMVSIGGDKTLVKLLAEKGWAFFHNKVMGHYRVHKAGLTNSKLFMNNGLKESLRSDNILFDNYKKSTSNSEFETLLIDRISYNNFKIGLLDKSDFIEKLKILFKNRGMLILNIEASFSELILMILPEGLVKRLLFKVYRTLKIDQRKYD